MEEPKTPPEGEQQEPKEPVEPQEGNEPSKKKEDDDSFYEQELERLKKESEEKDEKIKRYNEYFAKQRIEKKEEKEDKEDDVRAVISQELDVREQRNYVREHASSAKEAELILYHLENSIQKSGDISTDFNRAQLIANESKIRAKETELSEAEKAKQKRGTGIPSATPIKGADRPKLSPEDEKMLSDYTWNADKSRFEPPEGGKFALKYTDGEFIQESL